MYNDKLNNLNKEDFKLVKLEEKILDKGFEGKPRSSMADATIRFTKNKANVVAFVIVALIIMLSIFVPILSKKDFTSDVVQNLQNLPPRIPLLEKIGIADGSSKVSDVPVDYTKKDPESGLFLPSGNDFSPEYIKSGSLKNKTTTSTLKKPSTLHGQSVIYLDQYNAATIKSKETLKVDVNDIFNINIQKIDNDSRLSIYLDESNNELSDNKILIGVIDDNSISQFTINEEYTGYLTFVYEKNGENLEDSKSVEIVDVKISSNLDDEKYYFEGYNLSIFEIKKIPNQGGRYERINGEYTSASFDYYTYNKIFSNVNIKIPGISSSNVTGFLDLLEKHPELAEEFKDYTELINENIPTSGEKRVDINYTFKAEGVPIRKVNYVTIIYNKFLNTATFTYDVELDGAYYNGFSSMPYFWFGTDKDGRDLFAQIWLSLRTSLFLGLVVSIINILVGVVYGAIEGYYGGKVDFVMERVADYIASFPGLTILTIIYLNYGPGLALLLIYLTYSGWISIASTTRIQFYRYRGREYVLASKSMGASDKRLIFKHILPNAIGIIITRSILSIPSMIFVEASLSFLGFGIGRGVTLDFGLFKMPGLSLGVILQEGQGSMLIPGRFYQLLIPSIIIIVLMISFNMFGNGLRDAFNPTLRGEKNE